MSESTITLGGGCFWCVEAVMLRVHGVSRSVSGYAGGTRPNPTYELISTGTSGYAEVTQVTFDPAVLPLDTLLDIFFTVHDPTTLNRQGADVGPQYRSAIFYHDEVQRLAAEAAIQRMTAAGLWADPIVTEVSPLTNFYPAESYHQNYYDLHPDKGYCRVVISPKIAKFREKFPQLIRSTNAT
jgi:peptide-methionine (S)-S-oxide reductase